MTRIAVSGHRGFTAEVESFINRAVRAELAAHAERDLVGISCMVDGTGQTFARHGPAGRM